MTIKKIHKDYFQKSRVFLYPALDIRKGSKIIPVQTYIAWEEVIQPSDRKLICLYKMQDTEEFRVFERAKLLNNKRFCDFMRTTDDQGLYVFSFEKDKGDFDKFLKGKYSKISAPLKASIEKYYGADTKSYEFVMSYLYPEDYFHVYADLLNVDVSILRDVGQLCAPIDLDKETLKMSVENLEIPDLLI